MKFFVITIVAWLSLINILFAENQYFIENQGQWEDNVRYMAKVGGLNVWITDDGIIYDIYTIKNGKQSFNNSQWDISSDNRKLPVDFSTDELDSSIVRNGQIVKMDFKGSSNNKQIIGANKLSCYYNYLRGNDSSKWLNFVPVFSEVIIKNLYEGIDYKLYFDNGLLRYDIILNPFAEIGNIKIKYEGQNNIFINNSGDLVVETNIDDIINDGLFAYQILPVTNKYSKGYKKVNCKYYIDDKNIVKFKVDNYDKNLALVIDPFLYSSVFGAGDILDWGPNITIDESKSVYLTSVTAFDSLPTDPSPGPYMKYGTKTWDAIVCKLNPDGSKLEFFTYIGGSATDISRNIFIDRDHNIVISGETFSTNYPTTWGVLKNKTNKSTDVFISRLNSDGSMLLTSTYFGGISIDQWPEMILDKDENIYLGGMTWSWDFPITEGAYSGFTDYTGYSNVFICKVNREMTKLLSSTLICADNGECVGGIALDKNNNILIGGWTYSNNLPLTDDAYDKLKGDAPNDSSDVFFARLSNDCKQLLYSTYFGGGSSDKARCMAIDRDGNPCISGYTTSKNFPLTDDAYDNAYNAGWDMFVSKFSPDCKHLLYSTYYGGEQNEWSSEIAVDKYNNIYITGAQQIDDYLVTPDSSKLNKLYKTVISKLTPGNRFESYYLLGDSSVSSNQGTSIAIDNEDHIYLSGIAYFGFPTTYGAFYDTMRRRISPDSAAESSGGNNYVCKITFECDAFAFDFPNFSSVADLTLAGDAVKSGDKMQLTESDYWNSGAIWFGQRIPAREGFQTEFSFSITDGVNKYEPHKVPGADGIAFVIQNDSPNALGAKGGGIGFDGIRNSLAVEFDTYLDYNFESPVYDIADSNGNHIAVFCNWKEPNSSIHRTPDSLVAYYNRLKAGYEMPDSACIATYNNIMPIVRDGRKYFVKIVYEPLFRALQVYLDTSNRFDKPNIMTIMGLDISWLLEFPDDGTAWVGITSATGVAFENHYIHSWSYCPNPILQFTGIDEINRKDDLYSLEIYPNPANEFIDISYPSLSNDPVFIDIYDLSGEIVRSGSDLNFKPGIPVRFDTKNISNGVYFLVLNQGGKVLRRSFVITK